MKRLLMILLIICLTLPAMAEAPAASGVPECWVVSHGCLTDFLQAWADENNEAMLALCAPSWKAQQADPELALFLLVQNCTAKAWRIGEMSFDGEKIDYMPRTFCWTITVVGSRSGIALSSAS